jgi:putative MFS transporter
VPITDLFHKGVRRSTVVIAILWFCLNYSGYAITVWLPVLLTRQMGYQLGKGLTFLAIAQLISCTGNFSAGWAADFFGRKITLAYSYLLFGASTYFFFWFGKNPAYGSPLLIIMLIFLGSSFATLYAFSPESFPTRVRATGTGFAGATGRLGGILGPTFVGLIYGSAGIKWVLHVNMIVLTIAVLVMLTVARETRRRSLEEIEAAATGRAFTAGAAK